MRERLLNPHAPAAGLHGLHPCYKIKPRTVGDRLVYEVNDHVVVTVIAVGKRDKGIVYRSAKERL